MTTARIERGGGSYRITVKGHANSADSGQDIVCAAASILTTALLYSVANAEEDGACETETNIKDANVRMEIHAVDRDRIDEIVNTIENGYIALEESAPQYFKIVTGNREY